VWESDEGVDAGLGSRGGLPFICCIPGNGLIPGKGIPGGRIMGNWPSGPGIGRPQPSKPEGIDEDISVSQEIEGLASPSGISNGIRRP
jgi:hypothetical protein